MGKLGRIALAIVAVALASWGTAYSAEGPEFRLGFAVLAEQIPQVVGQPVEEEHYQPNGDAVQRTTTGLMVWRKADNWTAFTDGASTWINGPGGLQSRPNSERFDWESGTGGADQGIDPRKVTLDTREVPFRSYRVDAVAGTAYDTSGPPGPKGMPRHLEVGFGLIDQPGPRAYHPVMYVIPVDAYSDLWEQNGNSAVSKSVARIKDLGQQIPSPTPIRSMPLLPYELTTGVNDLAVQVKTVVAGDMSALGIGFRYVGRFAQDANPVTNDGSLRYIYQGFTRDGRYLVSFSCEVYTGALPERGRVPQKVLDRFAANNQDYLRETAAMLNAIPSSAWELDLDKLDRLVSSLRFLDGSEASAEPFSLDFVRGVAWTKDRAGYDPQLPGYHLAGDIAVLEIRPTTTQLPDGLILDIATTPDMPPMLEGFVLRTSDVSVRTSLAKAGAVAHEEVIDGSSTRLLSGGTYLRISTAGSRVLVEFLPRGMELLRQPCTVEWVDWYR